jgi:glutathione S-transferase
MSTASVTQAVLAELGVDCETITLDISAGDTRTPAFLKVNPNGRVPVIVHEGGVIWESSAITMYLGELHGVDAGLYPVSGPARGQAMKWLTWSSATLAEAAARLSASIPSATAGAVQENSVDWVAPENRSALLQKATADVTNCLCILNDELETKRFLLGDNYSLVDTHLYIMVGWILSMNIDAALIPNIAPWLERCGTRPALVALHAG